jgi:hypothetical protein
MVCATGAGSPLSTEAIVGAAAAQIMMRMAACATRWGIPNRWGIPLK